MKKIIELKSISKSFDGEPVLDSISLDIHDNEFVTLLGPSGCGKTTTLRIIGGFRDARRGGRHFYGRTHQRCPAPQAACQHGLPEIRAVSASERF